MAHRWCYVLASITIAILPIRLIGQADPRGAFHGTVNIVLANGNGAVIVTDSRLSSQHAPAGEAPKLFRLDDHTMCSVSDFYSVRGPSENDATYPGNIAIANVLDTLIDAKALSASETLDNKIQRIGHTLAFTLEVAWMLIQAQHIKMDPPRSELLFVTYEHSHYRVARLVITPTLAEGGYKFIALPPDITEVVNKLVYEVAGFTDVAEPALSGSARDYSSDGILKRYAKSLATSEGADLTLDEMLGIARHLEDRTAIAHQSEVGGAVEDAEFVGKVASFINPYPRSKPGTNLMPGGAFGLVSEVNDLDGGMNINTHSSVLFLDSHFGHSRHFYLDHAVIFRSSFEHCKLVLDDASDFYFDTGNVIKDSVLELGPKIDADSLEVRKLLTQYKGDLRLVRASESK